MVLLLLLSPLLLIVRRGDPHGVHVEHLIVRLGVDRPASGRLRRRRHRRREAVGGTARRSTAAGIGRMVGVVVWRFRRCRQAAISAVVFEKAVVHRRISAIVPSVPTLQ